MSWKEIGLLLWVVFNLCVACLYVIPITLIYKKWRPKLLSCHIRYTNQLSNRL